MLQGDVIEMFSKNSENVKFLPERVISKFSYLLDWTPHCENNFYSVTWHRLWLLVAKLQFVL